MFILVNIGCIECGVSSNIVGVYESEAAAYRDATILSDKLELREGGQNSYEVFPLPEPNVITDEYRGALRASATEEDEGQEELVSRGR